MIITKLQSGTQHANKKESFHMICDTAAQLDIRKMPPELRPVPHVVDFEGERLVTTWTTTQFGGRRQWWLCPSCDRRCAIIYRRGKGPLWGCRICMGGRYASEHKSPRQRLLQKIKKLRKRLGQTSGFIGTAPPPKPTNMHWRTYDRLVAELEAMEAVYLAPDFEAMEARERWRAKLLAQV
ncbi:hypothetical protein [Tropicibacter alexandrii]|uniref:hypothetical protein n=1 Tax=Tropicibacter alexandrii TaxID=2267683 RepID=UPI001008D7FF|nr:hypothetical protein [Tropicibacter alexandrii]